MESFADVIAAWPSQIDLAEDVGVNPKLVAVWKFRNAVPSAYWDRLITGAGRRGIRGVTLELLSGFERNRVAPAGPDEAA